MNPTAMEMERPPRPTLAQMRLYRLLCARAGLDDELRRRRLRELYGVSSSAELSRSQIAREIDALQRITGNGLRRQSTARMNVSEECHDDRATPAQLALIEALRVEAQISPAGLEKVIRSVLIAWNRWRQQPISRPEHLTIEQAIMVIESLKALKRKPLHSAQS